MLAASLSAALVALPSHQAAHTLVVVMGSLRGGEQVWHTLDKNVLVPLSADLAVLVAFDQEPNWLTRRAQHLWRVGEFSDWAQPIAATFGPFRFRYSHAIVS